MSQILDTLAGVPAPWVAVISAVLSGVVLKWLESYLNRKDKRDSTPAELREELRLQIEGLKSDVERRERIIDETEKELGEIREKYWALREEYNKIHRQMLDYLSELTQIREELKVKEDHRVNRDQ